MNKKILPIRGMHCRSCEVLIAEKLKEIPEVRHVQVSYKKKQAVIYSKTQLSDKVFASAIREAGYDIGNDDKAIINTNPSDWRDLGLAFIILIVLYLIVQDFGLTNISASGFNNPSSLIVVLIVGLTAGLSTCMALVGGLVLGIASRFSEKHPEATPIQKFRPHLFFNLGRTLSYFTFGGLVGLIGSAFQLSGTFLGLMTIVVGIVMLILGLQLTEIFPRLSSGGLTLPNSLSKFLGIRKHHEREYSHKNSAIVGALTFFLPCGFTQAMQLYAMSTGSFWSGAMIMGIFALGTAPGLLGVGGLTAIVQGAFAKRFFKFAGLLVVALSIFNLSNGWNLTGWKLPSFSTGSNSGSNKNSVVIKEDNGVQVVNMTQSSYGYSPSNFTIKKGVPVKWVINSTDSQTCAASISFSKFGIRKALKPGENIIEFTPNEAGNFKFSCSMGMYRGVFNVVDDPNGLNSTNSQNSSPNGKQTPVAQSTPSDQKSDKSSSSQPDPSSGEGKKNDTNSPVQVIKTTFDEVSWSAESDISPSSFTVSAGKPVRFEVTANADGVGCMSTIMIPGLANEPELLEKGKTIAFEFTPTKKGSYDITCAMGVPRGTLTVV